MSADDRRQLLSRFRRPWSYPALFFMLLPLLLIVHIVLQLAMARAADDGCFTPRERREWELFKAADLLDSGKIRQLVRQGVNPNANLEVGTTPLHRASEIRGNIVPDSQLSSVQILVDAGADVHGRDSAGQTPLELTLATRTIDRKGQLHLANILIEADADVNAGGGTMLVNMILYRNWDVVKLLLEHGAKIKPANSTLETPLHCAIRTHADETTIQLLRDYERSR